MTKSYGDRLERLEDNVRALRSLVETILSKIESKSYMLEVAK